MNTIKTTLSPALAILIAIASLSGPALATDLKTTESSGGETEAADNPPAHNGTIKKVQITNLSNGEVGCHNRETQTSTPGPC